MSSGSGKGGSAQQSHDYYGTIMGVIGIGPIASIQSVILNGTQVFGVGFVDANGNHGSALVYGVGGVGEGYSLNVPGLGPVIIHWGFETAAPDTVLNQFANHPPYKGFAYIVLNNCLFGTQQQTAPNIEFVVSAAPNQSVVTGPAAALDANGNANAVAIAAELATAWHGLNLPVTAVNVASFQAVADSIRLDPIFSQGLSNISPVWKQQTDARSAFGDTQCTCDLWFGFDQNGLLMCGQWLRGGPTGAITAITANQWTTPPKDETDDITAIPTGFDIMFADNTQLYSETSAPTNNLLAVFLGAIGKRQQLRRSMLTSVAQAHVLGGECLRLLGNQTVVGTVAVRASQAVNPDGTPIRPGSYFMLDTQQEPGQAGSLQLCRCMGRSYDPESAITLEYEYDPGAVPTPYVVPYSNNAPIPYVVPPLNFQRTGSLPPAPGQPPTLFILAMRTDPSWIGVQVFEDTIINGDYAQIGTQVGFALPTELQAPIAATDTTIIVNTIPSFAGLPGNIDVGYLNNALGVNSDSAARNNTLLCILVRKNPLTGAQYANVTLPWLEICSVVETSLIGPNQYSVQLIRGRMGTYPLAFDTAGGAITFPDIFYCYEAWFIPSSLLVAFGHTDFAMLAATGGTAYFEFAPLTAKAVYSPQAAYAAGLQANPQWTPIWAYPFPTGYTQAPVVTITSPAPAASTNTTGQFSLTFSVADPTNSIAKITAFAAMSADGSQNTALMSQDILNDGTYNYGPTVFALPNVEGNFTITVRVTNAYNVTTVQTVQIYRAIAVSGYSLSAPAMSPASMPISGSAQITITKPGGSSGTSQLQSSIDNGATWQSYPTGSNSVQVTVLPNHALLARMTDTGPVYSAVTGNYYPNAIFGGGYLAGTQP